MCIGHEFEVSMVIVVEIVFLGRFLHHELKANSNMLEALCGSLSVTACGGDAC
jgi:hypothetical protein